MHAEYDGFSGGGNPTLPEVYREVFNPLIRESQPAMMSGPWDTG
jgi:hypothetical protein